MILSRWKTSMFPCFMVMTLVVTTLYSTMLFAQEVGEKLEIISGTPALPMQDKIKMDRLENMNLLCGRFQEECRIAEEMRAQLINNIMNECGLSPENVKPLMLEMERELFGLRTTQETRPLQRRFLAESIKEIADENINREKSDNVLLGLEKIANYHHELRMNLEKQREKGVVSETELIKKNTECVEAEMRIALRREELAKNNGNGYMERLNREIQEQATSEKTDALRIAHLENKWEKLRMVQDKVNKVDKLNEQIKRLSQKIDQVEQILLKIEVDQP